MPGDAERDGAHDSSASIGSQSWVIGGRERSRLRGGEDSAAISADGWSPMTRRRTARGAGSGRGGEELATGVCGGVDGDKRSATSPGSTIAASYSMLAANAWCSLAFKHQAAFLRATHPDPRFLPKKAAFVLVTKQYTDKQLIEGTM